MYLDSIGKPTRYSGKLHFIGEFSCGVLYLRDDGVRTLISRIRDLEQNFNEALYRLENVKKGTNNHYVKK